MSDPESKRLEAVLKKNIGLVWKVFTIVAVSLAAITSTLVQSALTQAKEDHQQLVVMNAQLAGLSAQVERMDERLYQMRHTVAARARAQSFDEQEE